MTFGSEAQLGRVLSFEQIGSDVTQYCRVLCPIVPSDSAVVFAESDIHDPVHLVFNTRMEHTARSIDLAFLIRLEMKW